MAVEQPSSNLEVIMRKYVFKINPEHCPDGAFDNRTPELWEAGQFKVPWPHTLDSRSLELHEILRGDTCWIWLHVERKKDKERRSPGLVGQAVFDSVAINSDATSDDKRLLVRFTDVNFRKRAILRDQFEKHQEHSETVQNLLRYTTRRVAALTDDQVTEFEGTINRIDDETQRLMEQYSSGSSSSTNSSIAESNKAGGSETEIEEERAAEREYEARKKAEDDIQNRTDIGETEKAQLVNARRGQGVFRRNLRNYEKYCRLTGIDQVEHLRASHIKPWRVSSDFQKLDGNNGLLLSPHIDHLFDQGYISFRDSGGLLVSRLLAKQVLSTWRISEDQRCGPFRAEQLPYLAYHREHIFKKT